MSKFSGRKLPIFKRTPTYEGGEGFERTPQAELFLLAVTNMVGEDTYYEDASTRDARFASLVRKVTVADADFVARFVPYLRDVMQMRSASIVIAAEYVAAGGANGRRVVANAMQRADEPAEMLGYWMSTRGRAIPAAIKRGIADAAQRLYTERAALKYDGVGRAIRMADVIELTHPTPRDTKQSALFRYLLDHRHRGEAEASEYLPMIRRATELQSMPVEARRETLNSSALGEAGFTWERLSGWLPGGMDAAAWESMIPSMGYMALIRNLRNFDEAGISAELVREVQDKLRDPDEVARSRQFPYRFWSAYKFAPSVVWASVLEDALEQSVANVPVLDGRTLVLIDTSASMQSPVSNRSKVMRFETGALFAATVAKRAAKADVVIFGTDSRELPVVKGQSVLRYIEKVEKAIGSVGHGTEAHKAMMKHFDGHDRVVIFTDEQTHDSASAFTRHIPAIYTFNLAGYRVGMTPETAGRYTFGGFTDAVFSVMKVLESNSERAGWPF